MQKVGTAKETIAEWVDAYSDSMYSWALHKTSSREMAEDLVQETFLAAVQSYEKFKGDSKAKTWLFSILNNKIIDHYRKAYKNPTVSEQQQIDAGSVSLFETMFDSDGRWLKTNSPQEWTGEPEHVLDDVRFNDTLQHCMEVLPANWNAAIRLKYLEEKNAELVCQELEISTTNYWQILHRAKLQLRKCLDENWFNK